MKLSIPERIILTDVLSGYETTVHRIGAVRKLIQMTTFTAEELDSFNVVQLPNGSIRWDVSSGVEQNIDIPYSEGQIKVVGQILGEHPKLSAKHLSVLEKFGVKIPEENV